MIPIFIISGKSPFDAFGGGYSSYAYNLAKILKKLNTPVYIVTLANEAKTTQTPIGTLLNFKSPFLKFNQTALPFLPIYSFIFARGIEKIMMEKKYKKIIIWGIGPWGLTGTILKRKLGSKVIHFNNYFTTIKHEWDGPLKMFKVQDFGVFVKIKYTILYYTLIQILSFFEKAVLNSTDLILTNYQSTEAILQQEFKIPKSKFYRTHFTTQIFKRKGLEDTPTFKLPKQFIFFISRHELRKGVNFLLHAYKILLARGVKIPLLIAGTGQMHQANIQLARKLGVERQVKFLGFINNPKPILKKATIFVFPTLEEGAGALIINEAMSQGVPIVSTNCDGIAKDIENNKSGLLVPRADPIALADAIQFLLENPKVRLRLGQNAKVRFKKLFRPSLMEEDVKKLLKVFLKSR